MIPGAGGKNKQTSEQGERLQENKTRDSLTRDIGREGSDPYLDKGQKYL